MEPVIEIEGLCKNFRVGFWRHRTRILHPLTLTVYRGEIFGYLGPNGAGKTTTIKLLTGPRGVKGDGARARVVRPDSQGKPQGGGNA